MWTNERSLLATILGCKGRDLILLRDVNYDWGKVVDECMSEYGNLQFNNIIRIVFYFGLCDIQEAIDSRIADLEAIERFDFEEEELKLLQKLDALRDFDSLHNLSNTMIWCGKHKEIYKEYLEHALDEFEENTGFCIEMI